MSQEIGKRLRAARKAVGLTQKDVAHKIGVTFGAVSQWELGGTTPKGGNLMKLAQLYNVTPESLVGDGKVTQHPSMSQSNVEGSPFPVRQGRVPVKGNAQLGPEGYFEAMSYPVEMGDGYIMIESSDVDAYGLRVVGNSMTPRIKHNEYVVIEPNHSYVAGDEVLICTTDGQCMIKTFIWLRDGQYRFDSINDDFDPLYLFEEDVERIHYVGAIAKPSRYSP